MTCLKKNLFICAAFLLLATSVFADSVSQTASLDSWKINKDMNSNGFSGYKNSLAVGDFKAGNNAYVQGVIEAFFGNWKIADADFQAAINDWNGAALALGDPGMPGATTVPEPGVWMLILMAGFSVGMGLRAKNLRRFVPVKLRA